MEKIKSTIIHGIFLVVPILFLILILKAVIEFLGGFVEPIEKILPAGAIFGHGNTTLASVFILFILIIIFGLIARTERMRRFNAKIEVLIPGYKIVKSIFGEDDTLDNKSMKPCLATVDEAWLFAFIIEEHASGMLTVFMPSAPTPTSGNLYFFTEQQVKRLNIPNHEVIKYIMQFGAGAKTLLDAQIKW